MSERNRDDYTLVGCVAYCPDCDNKASFIADIPNYWLKSNDMDASGIKDRFLGDSCDVCGRLWTSEDIRDAILAQAEEIRTEAALNRQH